MLSDELLLLVSSNAHSTPDTFQIKRQFYCPLSSLKEKPEMHIFVNPIEIKLGEGFIKEQ